MRYQGWFVLFIGLFAVSQLTFSANGCGVQGHSMARYAPSTFSSGHPGFRPYPAAVNTAYQSHYPDMRASGYRFRPWAPTQQARIERPVRYQPLPMKIPDRYVFRPLNPVARPAKPMPVQPPPMPAQPQPPGYPALAYPWTGGGYYPYAYSPNRLWPYYPHRARSYTTEPWAGAVTAYRQPERFPARHAYPPASAQGANRMPRFRPWSYPGWERAHNRPYVPRYALQRPIRRYPSPVPPWGFDSAAAMTPYPGHNAAERTAQRPPIPPSRVNRYGTDWYDGRGDDDGAWYRLAMEKAPTVSQSWDSLPKSTQERLRQPRAVDRGVYDYGYR